MARPISEGMSTFVPVPRPLFAPLEGASAGLADLVLVRGGAFGFALTVGHEMCDAGATLETDVI